MGITAIYARLDQSELKRIKDDPERFWRLPNLDWNLSDSSNSKRSEIFDADKEWEVLAWLCSDVGRENARYQSALIEVPSEIDDSA